jgi:S-adenosylmethionine:tRNA ribosyltransferase-isomerase
LKPFVGQIPTTSGYLTNDPILWLHGNKKNLQEPSGYGIVFDLHTADCWYISPGKVRTSDFDFALPPELIAQHPASRRDQSRLLVLERSSGNILHRTFPDLLAYLRGGDVLVLNDSKVIPARLRGVNARTGGKFELLLLHQNAVNEFWAMIKPGKRAHIDTEINLYSGPDTLTGITATVLAKNDEGHVRVKFSGTPDIRDDLDRIGEIPLPPYIERSTQLPEDRERYQTVYAQARGSVAAPTAGLHFTPDLLERIKALGVRVCYVTLHVGLGTFAPVKAEDLADHRMHEEAYEIPAETAATINEAKDTKQRVIAVGTTSVRVLESAATKSNRIVAGSGATNIFIYPPCEFRIVDALLTNFHLPRSTLIMLVSAFAAPGETRGRELVLGAYRQAVRERYRFFSYGDAMLLL